MVKSRMGWEVVANDGNGYLLSVKRPMVEVEVKNKFMGCKSKERTDRFSTIRGQLI